MSKMIQLRHVPDDLHRKLKARAASEGLSLSDFLVREARRVAEQPTLEEIRSRVRARSVAEPRLSSARIIRGEREKS